MTPSSFITPGHVRAFQAVTSRLYDNIMLWSCRINGEPGVAITVRFACRVLIASMIVYNIAFIERTLSNTYISSGSLAFEVASS